MLVDYLWMEGFGHR